MALAPEATTVQATSAVGPVLRWSFHIGGVCCGAVMKKPKPISAATKAMLEEMEREMAADAAKPASADKVELARMKAAELRDLEKRKSDLEEQLKQVNVDIEKIKWQDLVDLMQEARLDAFTLQPEGNHPAYDVRMTDHYHANIPEENEPVAFKWLHDRDLGDMVKTTFIIPFGLNEAKECAAFMKKLDKMGEAYEVKQKVPWNTLTSWVKGEFKANRPLSEKVMSMLGATAKKVVNIKSPKKEK